MSSLRFDQQPHVGVLVRSAEYGPAELIAGRSTAQELHTDCCALFVDPDLPGRLAARNREANAKLAETLGLPVIDASAADPTEAAITFVRDRHISHLIVGCRAPARPMDERSLEARVAAAVRGVEVRVVEKEASGEGPNCASSIGRNTFLPVILLAAILVLAAAAIAYVSWPLVFSLVVIAAATWCWRLEGQQT